MSLVLHPWQLLLIILGGWIQRHQQEQLEFHRTQLLVLLEVIGKKRILLNDDQRRRLAVRGERGVLPETVTIIGGFSGFRELVGLMRAWLLIQPHQIGVFPDLRLLLLDARSLSNINQRLSSALRPFLGERIMG